MKKDVAVSVASRVTIVPKTDEYVRLLKRIKDQIVISQVRASSAANRILLALYWNIGREIVARQEQSGWGKSIIEKLSIDICREFPDVEGFSSRNLWRMRSFHLQYRETVPQVVAEPFAFLPQVVAEIPWGHHVLLMEKIKDKNTLLWYANHALQNGWSRDVMRHHIDTHLHKRQGKTVNNFLRTLPQAHSDLARQTLKDPYLFNFLSSDKRYREKELETALMDNVEQFLLELGAGFSLVGRQVHLKVADQDYHIDLLFYHLKLRCFVVIELKAEPFKPEHAGQINFYLAALDDTMKQPQDNPTIGLLLCRTKRSVVVEYALRNLNAPIGVADWQTKLVKKLPKQYQSSLPTVKEIETELLHPSKKEKSQ